MLPTWVQPFANPFDEQSHFRRTSVFFGLPPSVFLPRLVSDCAFHPDSPIVRSFTMFRLDHCSLPRSRYAVTRGLRSPRFRAPCWRPSTRCCRFTTRSSLPPRRCVRVCADMSFEFFSYCSAVRSTLLYLHFVVFACFICVCSS